jgi:hypothetical protein
MADSLGLGSISVAKSIPRYLKVYIYFFHSAFTLYQIPVLAGARGRMALSAHTSAFFISSILHY